MAALGCNPRTWEGEIERVRAGSQPGLHREPRAQNKTETNPQETVYNTEML